MILLWSPKSKKIMLRIYDEATFEFSKFSDMTHNLGVSLLDVSPFY